MVFTREIRTKHGTYYAQVESYRKEGKVKQRVIRYLGKKIDGQITKKVYTKDIVAQQVKRSVDVHVINKIAQDLGIGSIKNKCFLALVYIWLALL